jgi:LacI family transcriptional regulator
MKDVAALAGVSVGTVSNAVNTPGKVNPATLDRIEQAIAKLGWIPNASARQLREGTSRVVAVVVMDLSNPFFTDVIAGAEEAVQEAGLSVQVGNSAQRGEREATMLQLLAQQHVRGVLLAPIDGPDSGARELRRHGIPVVLVDRAGGQSDFCSVSVDDVEGGRLAVQHLLDYGHTTIAVVGGRSGLQQITDRRLGGELAASGRPARPRLLIMSTPTLDVSSGIRAGEELAALPETERPTAVFALNDLLAIGVLQGLLTGGLRVPDDMAIVGYDDIEFAAAAAVPLSSVRQPRVDLGLRAAQLLFAEIQDADRGQTHRHQQVRFTPELVIRGSSGVPLDRKAVSPGQLTT